jgi:hypothetical protein
MQNDRDFVDATLLYFIFAPLKIFEVGVYIYIYTYIYRVSQEECAILRESVPYVKLYRYNPKNLYPK